MSRSSRSVAVWTAALTLGVASLATAVAAQSTDSARTPPPGAPGRGMGPMRGVGPRFGGDGLRRMDDRALRGEMRGRRLDGDRRGFGPGPRGVGVARRARAGYLMRGITLSADQEKALRTNQARHLSATKPLMLELFSARTDQQLATLNGDQKGLDAATARLTAARAKLDSLREKRSPVEDLRAVLTPEQQKLLDRNLSEAAQGRGAMGPARGGRMGPGGMRPGAAPRGFRDRPLPPRRGDDGADTDLAGDIDPGLFGWLDLDDDDPTEPPAR